MERWGRKPTLVAYLLGTAVSALLFGTAGTGIVAFIALALLSFFNLGAWGVVYTYSPELYPTAVRATGAGVAAAVGRIGGIIGPFLTPVIVAIPQIGQTGVTIDGPAGLVGAYSPTDSVSSRATNGGRAGSVSITSGGALRLANGARVATDVVDGEVDSAAGAVLLDTTSLLTIDSSTVSSGSDNAGAAGDVTVRGAGVLIRNQSSISADFLFGSAGGPGSISVAATGWDCVDVAAAAPRGIRVAAVGE